MGPEGKKKTHTMIGRPFESVALHAVWKVNAEVVRPDLERRLAISRNYVETTTLRCKLDKYEFTRPFGDRL